MWPFGHPSFVFVGGEESKGIVKISVNFADPTTLSCYCAFLSEPWAFYLWVSQFSAKKISFTFTVYLRVKVVRLQWDIFNQYGLVLGGGEQEEGVEGEGGGARAFRILYFLPGLVVTVWISTPTPKNFPRWIEFPSRRWCQYRPR